MILRFKALRSLRWNYKRRGVWVWLKGRQRCRECNATGYTLGPSRDLPLSTIACPICRSECKVTGWKRIAREPEKVIAEQTAMAEGVFA